MKINWNWLCIACVCWCEQFVEIASAPSSAPFKPSQPLPAASSPLDSSDKLAISLLRREAAREKRAHAGSASGSGDILNHIKNSIGQGIKNKIGQLAKSSAGASAYFSHSSSGHGDHGHGPPVHYYPPAPHHHGGHDDGGHKGFDFWTIKKGVLYTLLQAVKAIKGGVIAIKGQIIKGGGHLLTAKGKLIRGGGEALTNIGKNIASSAFMWVPDTHEDIHQAEEHYEQPEHPAGDYGYSAPTGGASGYGGGGHHYQNSIYPEGGYYHNYERDRSYATFDPYY